MLSVCHTPVDLFKKGSWRDIFPKRSNDNGLNRQLGIFFWGGGGQEWCIEGEGNSERCLKWGGH